MQKQTHKAYSSKNLKLSVAGDETTGNKQAYMYIADTYQWNTGKIIRCKKML